MLRGLHFRTVSFEYVLRVNPGGECTVTRDRALSEHQVIESPLGSLVVEEVEAHPGDAEPGRANCRPFAPIHST